MTNEKLCKNCGIVQDDDARHCIECGANLEQQANEHRTIQKRKMMKIIAVLVAVIIVAVGIWRIFFFGSGVPESESLIIPESVIIGIDRFETSLTELSLWRRDLYDEDIVNLRYMVNLRELNLTGNHITDWSPVAHVLSVYGRP